MSSWDDFGTNLIAEDATSYCFPLSLLLFLLCRPSCNIGADLGQKYACAGLKFDQAGDQLTQGGLQYDPKLAPIRLKGRLQRATGPPKTAIGPPKTSQIPPKRCLGPSQGVQGSTREAPGRHRGGTREAPRRHQGGNLQST